MKFVYVSSSVPVKESDEYFTDEDMRDVIILPVDRWTDLLMESQTRTGWDLTPVSSYDMCSWEFAECIDEDEARDTVQAWLNCSVFEFVHDL